MTRKLTSSEALDPTMKVKRPILFAMVARRGAPIR